MTNDNTDTQIAARLTVHEFLLEVFYANWFAQLPPANAAQMATDFRSRMRKAYTAADADPDYADKYGLQVAQDAAELMDRFLTKVESRVAQIRK